MENEEVVVKRHSLAGRKRSPEFVAKLKARIAERKASGKGWGRTAKKEVVVPEIAAPINA